MLSYFICMISMRVLITEILYFGQFNLLLPFKCIHYSRTDIAAIYFLILGALAG